MTWLEFGALTNAVSAATLGGLAIAYARFVWTHGNGLRRFMRWLAPLWALVAFYHAAIWVADTFHPAIDTLQWMRPFSWLLLAIPACVLFGSLVEDTKHPEQEKQAEQQLALFAERHGRG